MSPPPIDPAGGYRPARRRPRGIDRGPRRLADSLDDALAGLSAPAVVGPTAGRAGATMLGTVFSRWDDIVGSALARHVRPLTLRGGVLAVAVDQPAWATQVRALGGTILERVGEAAGERPTELRVVVRPGIGGGT